MSYFSPDKNVIELDKVSKVYKLYNTPLDRLKEAVSPFSNQLHSDYYALNDVSLTVKAGEIIGVLGKNGSGKSTLLKLIAGIITPTSGTVKVQGNLSSLIELGAGFNPELTGIENVFFNATIMGYSQKYIEECLDSILSFADIGQYIQQPVKTYSSGMFSRLAFAVAINISPDILIVDEALSVGDIRFQRKCFSKIEELQSKNVAILFVSHSMDTINTLCNKAIWLNDGVVMSIGDTSDVTKKFRKFMLGEEVFRTNVDESLTYQQCSNSENLLTSFNLSKAEFDPGYINDKLSKHISLKRAEIISFCILDAAGSPVTELKTAEKYIIRSVALVYEDLEEIHFGFPIKNVHGLLIFGVNSHSQRLMIPSQTKGSVLEALVEITMWLAPGSYFLSFGVGSLDKNYDYLNDVICFKVVGDCLINPSSIVNLSPKMTVRTV